MLENNSGIPYPKEFRLNLYEIDSDITRYNDPVTVGINGVENSTEEKLNHCPRNTQKNSTGCLKSLLIGVMGTCVLASAGYCCYVLGRASGMWQLSEKTAIYPEGSLALADNFGNIALAMQMNNQHVVADFARTPGVSRSPYSYYENKKNTASITSEASVSGEVAITNRSEKNRIVHSETVITDNYYPLDSIFKRELANFCLSSLHSIVIKSNKAKPEYKCELLNKVIEKIYYYKNIDSDLRLINSRRDQLSVEEENTEIMIRRKLTTLYLAAETIISGKDVLNFYIHAMRDDKKYTLGELKAREEKIMNYFSEHQHVGEC